MNHGKCAACGHPALLHQVASLSEPFSGSCDDCLCPEFADQYEVLVTTITRTVTHLAEQMKHLVPFERIEEEYTTYGAQQLVNDVFERLAGSVNRQKLLRMGMPDPVKLRTP